MIHWSLLFYLSILLSGSLAYSSKPTPPNEQLSVWARLSTIGSKTLLKGLESNDYQVIEDALTQPNITFLLPRDSVLQSAISTGTLNFTRVNETIPQLLRHILPGTYPANSLLNGRQYILTNDSTHLPLAIGPRQQTNNNNNNDNDNDTLLQIDSGVVTANVIIRDIHCSNGIIHLIDQFLIPPMETLSTIETIPELETHEQLMKSLNLTSVVSGPNKTVLAPNDAAWAAANSSTMPYGTLVHNLKYQVIVGIYLSTSLFTSSPDMTITLNTQRRDSSLRFQRAPDNPDQLLVIGKSNSDVARVIRSDIITTQGVVHIVDKVLSADDGILYTSGASDSPNDASSDGGGPLAGVPANNPSDMPQDAFESRGIIVSNFINLTLLISTVLFSLHLL
ncbi:FAS1 domain-containing protein [Phascolomyces articulosus]|uniref:FAS1 domain-containing protein n=1 Tax=Phascolomyces articulosus TaxID=60185 RepID=A0AAD5K9T1_9FUNG|nr:FAS1 domain-containing protein [Phascolomyces articulosus]